MRIFPMPNALAKLNHLVRCVELEIIRNKNNKMSTTITSNLIAVT